MDYPIAPGLRAITLRGLKTLTDLEFFALHHALDAGGFPKKEHTYYATLESLGWIRDGEVAHSEIMRALKTLVPGELVARLTANVAEETEETDENPGEEAHSVL